MPASFQTPDYLAATNLIDSNANRISWIAGMPWVIGNTNGQYDQLQTDLRSAARYTAYMQQFGNPQNISWDAFRNNSNAYNPYSWQGLPVPQTDGPGWSQVQGPRPTTPAPSPPPSPSPSPFPSPPPSPPITTGGGFPPTPPAPIPAPPPSPSVGLPPSGGLMGGWNIRQPVPQNGGMLSNAVGTVPFNPAGGLWNANGNFSGTVRTPFAPQGYDNWNPNDPRVANAGAVTMANGSTYRPRAMADMYGAGIRNPFGNAFQQYGQAIAMSNPILPTFPWARRAGGSNNSGGAQ